MKHSHFVSALAVVLFAGASSSNVRGAGSNAAEEAAIRKIIDAGGSASHALPDRIVWTGADKRPTVGDEKPEPTAGRASEDRVPGSQKVKTEVLRIVVADSRDLAYEYAKDTLAYDLTNGKHVSFDRGTFVVWQ